MLFNWQVEDTCVVFKWWHISNLSGMLLSCLAVFSIAAFYEWIRAHSTILEQHWQEQRQYKKYRNIIYQHFIRNKRELVRSSIYAILVAISFWLMLVFMTYNGYLMIATILGAGFGHFLFSCHHHH